jgi:hypothetical protein
MVWGVEHTPLITMISLACFLLLLQPLINLAKAHSFQLWKATQHKGTFI